MSDEVRTEVSVGGKPKRKLSPKAIMVIAIAAAVVIAVVVITIAISRWRNNGARYAQRLGEQIGVSPETAQKYAHMTLENASQYSCINVAATEFPFLYESKKTVRVSGVTIPEWVIYVDAENNTVTRVAYYNYEQLHKYGNGVKTKAHVESAGITLGMSPEAVQQYIGFAPLRVYYSDEGMQEAYKYYYNDQNTGNTVSYVLYINYNDGKAASALEEENQFILSMLTLD